MTRYCAATVLDYEKSQAAPLHYDRAYSDEEIWDNFTYLIQRIMPVAEESGVKITLRYLTDAKKRRIGEDIISRKILEKIGASSDIEFAYPTYRIYKRGEKNG